MDTTWSPYFQQPFFFNKQQNMWANRFQPTRPCCPNQCCATPPNCAVQRYTPKGNSQCFQINQDTCQVQIHLQQKKINQVTIWGQVTDCCGEPVENACVILCKQCICNGCEQYQPVQQTLTDCNGNYKFCLAPPCCCEQYKVMLEETEEWDNCNVSCSC